MTIITGATRQKHEMPMERDGTLTPKLLLMMRPTDLSTNSKEANQCRIRFTGTAKAWAVL